MGALDTRPRFARGLQAITTFALLGLGATLAGCDGTFGAGDPGPGLDAGPPAEWDGGPPPPPGEPTYELGAPPSEVTVAWPAPPVITRDVEVTTLAEATAAAATSGTRVRVQGAIDGVIEVRASDVELSFDPGASASGVFIGNRIARVTVRGGRLGFVELQLPGQFYPTEEFHREWMTTDVLVDRVDVDAADSAFLMRGGVRIAITNSRAHAVRYGVWIGDTADFESTDVILAGNQITCDGPEATVRLVHVVRSATIGNRLTNGAKHNYRVHGRSDLNWAARNTLLETGVMLGQLPDDTVGRQWFDDNVFHHRAPSLFELDRDIVSVVARRNLAYTDVWECLLCEPYPSGWVLEDNRSMPYTAPPPSP